MSIARPWSIGRTLVMVWVVLLVLLSVVAVVVWTWAGTQASLDWALGRAAATQPLTTEGARGSLRTGLQADRLAWRQDGLEVDARGVDLAWEPSALLRRTLHVRHARIQQLRIEDRRPPTDGPPSPPASLALPLDVALDGFAIERIEIVGATPVEATAVTGRYRYADARHALELDSAQVAGGSYRGRATVGGEHPMPVAADIVGQFTPGIPGSIRTLPLGFTARLEGPLADLAARAQIQPTAPPPPEAGQPQAIAIARLTPFAAQPVPEAQATLRDIDLAALWPQAPQTRLGGRLSVQPAGTATWAISAALSNGQAGPWDRQRLPVEGLVAEAQWRSGTVLVRSLQALTGGGRIDARGDWRGTQGWQVEGTVRRVDPARLYSTLAPLPVSGEARVRGDGTAIDFTVKLLAEAARARGTTPLAAALRALELRQVDARGRWERGLLTLPALAVRTADARLDGALEVRPAARTGSGQLKLEAPGLQGRVEGRVAETAGRGALRLSVADAGRTVGWVGKLPATPEALARLALAGRGELQLDWQGGWRNPTLQAQLTVPTLQLAAEGDRPALSVRDLDARVDGRLADAAVQLRGQAMLAQQRLTLALGGRGGLPGGIGTEAWRAQLARLELGFTDPALSAGTWSLALQRPVELRGTGIRAVEAAAGDAVLTAPVRTGPAQATVAWEPVRWRAGELQTAGRVTGLPLSWAELIGGPQLAGSALSGNLVFDAQWDAQLGATPRLRATIARSRGDLTVLAESADGAATRVAAGTREASLTVTTQGEELVAALRWDSERAGTAQGRLTSRLGRGDNGSWQWPADAPLAGNLQAQLPRIGVWSLLAPPGWRLRGSLAADVAIAGTRAEPRFAGTVQADDLALRSVVDGVALQGGRLRARLDGDRLLIDEFTLRGGGPADSGGLLRATGEGSWQGGKPQVRMTAQLTRLRASVRSDRELTVSGRLTGRLDATGTDLQGAVQVDRARIVLPEESAPRLDSDVIVRNAPAGASARGPGADRRLGGPAGEPARPARPVRLAVDLDLGNDFQLQGRGIETRLRGTLALAGESLASPRLTGDVSAAGGQYRAYGQRLNIERALLRFTGPLDNPALDVLAVRPNLIAQKVGVQITGRAQAPFVRLYAEPELSEAEKLSWLVLGRPAASGGAESALLQQAALALVASRTGTGTGRGIAGRFGLDELSVRRDGADGAAITLGKRFADNFYAAYERTLSGALGTLYVFYDLSRRLTLRAEAGERTGVDLIYSFSFD